MDWFQPLFGFRESTGRPSDYNETKSKLKLLENPPRIASDSAEYVIGLFSNPKLSDLREAAMAQLAASPGALAGLMQVDTVVGSSVSDLMAANPNSVFQVASQFNALEFATPKARPEDGVS